MRWEDHSVAELRTVARAYKKHISIGAPSKMSKKELITVLDKHLLIEEGTNKIKIRAQEQKPLMGKSLAKSKGERLYKTTLKKAQKKKRGELATAQQKDEAQIQSVVAERQSSSAPPSMTLEEQARADELETLKKFYMLEEKRIKDKPKRILEERMRKVEQGAGFQILEAFFDKEQIKLDAEIMMAEMRTNALKAEREKIIQEKTFSQGRGATADAMAIKPPMMETGATTTKDLIQGLPQELQDKIFGLLPQQLKKDVAEGTKAEQAVKDKKDSIKFLGEIRKKPYKVKDLVYDLMRVNTGFENAYYDINDEIKDNIIQYDMGYNESWSEAKKMRMLEKADNMAFKEMMNRFTDVIKKAKRDKLSNEDFLKELETEVGLYN